MRAWIVQLAAVLALCTAATDAATKKPVQHKRAARQKVTPPPPPVLPCGNLLAFQVLLDRQGFSPGELDGKDGPNFVRALTAMQTARKINTTGQADCDSWHALGGEQAGDLLTAYTIAPEDVKGPFESNIPRELPQQAKLQALSYRTPLERLAEKFHASPALLRTLNPGIKIDEGAVVRVPAVQPFDPDTKPTPDPNGADLTIVVSKEDSSLRAVKPDGTLLFFAPVTTGSEHDPLPPGDWKVTGVSWRPKFHYNPELFWDASEKDSKATIPPGPNNPVGVVWINLNLDHYGLHGTPEPSHVGHTESHGCVRLTNWDAARVTALVKPGTAVQFR